MKSIFTLFSILFIAILPLAHAEKQPLIGGIDHTALTVSKLQESEQFFVDNLGFSVRGRDQSYPAVFLGNGEISITLWQVQDDKMAVAFDRKNNVGLHHIALNINSFKALDELHKTLTTQENVTIEFAPELSYGGPAKHMMVYEPSGNRIEFIHRP